MQFCHVNVMDIVVIICTKYYLLQPYSYAYTLCSEQFPQVEPC